MQSLRHLLPSAGALVVFEAAGRLSSFTDAGRELGMSQAAVSYAIRRLEAQLGTMLFHRSHRRVRLTDAGERFFADVTLGLSHIRKSAEALRAQGSGSHVTLAASTAFASFWMMPRLQKLRDELPGIDLRIQTSDRDIDIVAEGIPLAVRGGTPSDWPGFDCAALAREEIYAVAAPRYLANFGRPQTTAALAGHRLIHLEEPFRPAADWRDWFRSAGVRDLPTNRGLVMNDYALVIQATMEGQGIALGWHHLVERLVAAGLLERISDHALLTGRWFHVVWPSARNLGESERRVRDWLAATRTQP
ncbi:LysR substrate-binding domain-containing protein [Pararhizobium haloflavum]|uniref:LysR substrate-binding domain-containing protein n=1 Tax=Pararhizobium haloflavum TaxID=2037914 RepID=UPI000C1A7D25|nr:LysR substrate-binding domain-containing protein [Pararhizobium haloflavum]